ncbi:hypothetical protein [Halorussus sp. AFM4]|uniref:hypothetical protein n=1 Tax=Halorussus sp. AFM4 TaxID=3421651 RepID=UPI003EBCE6FE
MTDEAQKLRSWSRRAFLSGGATAFVGSAGFSASSPDRPDEYYGSTSETHATRADDFRLHASSTAWSLTDEARAEVTTRQYLEPIRRDVTVERIELRSEVEVGDTIRRQTVTYGNIEEATRGFTSRRREFHSYPYWSIRHSVTATVHTESGTVQFDVAYAHSGEELGKLE